MKNPAADKRLPDDFRDLPDRAAGECLIGQLNGKEDRLILRPFRRVPRRFFLREINPEKAPQEPHGEHCADHTERIRGGVADRDVFARITEFRKHIPRGAQPWGVRHRAEVDTEHLRK